MFYVTCPMQIQVILVANVVCNYKLVKNNSKNMQISSSVNSTFDHHVIS
jgi:hypothetical protein